MRRKGTSIEDSDITAHSLGEADPGDSAEIDTLLAADLLLQAEVNDLLDRAAALRMALADEPAEALTEDRRARIVEEASHNRSAHRRTRTWAVAAALAVCAAAGLTWRLTTKQPGGEPAARVVAGFQLPPRSTPPPKPSQERYEQLKSLGYMADGDYRPEAESNTEAYAYCPDSDFSDVVLHPLSTLGMDVDTASYANVRRFIEQGQRPPADAVRIEELLNYFPYDDPEPSGEDTFAARLEVGPAPWAPDHRLVRVGLKTRSVTRASRPSMNLVFLIDVSGSMNEPAKLPLVQESLRLLAQQLREDDRVSMVVYAGAAGLVLPPTPGDRYGAIVGALDRLSAGGSTNGADGISLAYRMARQAFIAGGVNRVVLATDGDFNVGVSSEDALVRLVKQEGASGVFLTVLGFGMGNLKDATLEALADKGNGNYCYVDSPKEARKTLVDQLTSTLVTVARDAKIQVEFNPARVRSYRLIGYQNRLLKAEDFADDRKDGGEVGAGQGVTALYELVLENGSPRPGAALRYQVPRESSSPALSDELLQLQVRYQVPAGGTSRLQRWPLSDAPSRLEETSNDFRFAAAVASFGMTLRASPAGGTSNLAMAEDLAAGSLGEDAGSYRAGFLKLVRGAARFEPAPAHR